ncbi:hypothetical protein BaRGS_00027280 [Batillaria attramentaria]|uniref:Uncharacterized protein n=1 Tax=Batillaria attramentaria TaxID=370345 RepID=A0ABD0K380_9CAEN
MNSSLVQLPGCGKGPSFLLTQLKEGGNEGFTLMLTDGEKIWDGQLTEEDLDALSGNLKMDFNTYVSQTVKAFTRRDMADLNFAYQVKPQADGIVDLVWKKQVPGDIKVKMGSVPLYLKSNSAQSMCEIFSNCIDMMTELHGKIRSLESDNQRLSQERQNALKRLDKCVSAKEDLEKDLYSKFVAVLNSKKEQIRNMRNAEPSASTSDTTLSKKRGRGTARQTADVSDDSGAEDKPAVTQSSDEDARNTDEETPPKRQRGPVRAAKRDTGSSLALGDDDGDAVDDEARKSKGVVKRPARQRGGNKRQTPSKPVLPKVSSRSSDVGTKTPQRSSMRKSGSGHSDRSVDNLDTDDLLNDF